MIHRWFFGDMTKREAELLLMLDMNRRGTFLVRRSETNAGSFILSVKCKTESTLEVNHYEISSDGPEKFYLFPDKTFKSLRGLVKHYRGKFGHFLFLQV